MILGGAGIMLANIPLMLAAVFAMGVHSTFFGPIKYAILPQHLRKDEVLGGTGLVEAGTYIAILGGTILAGVLARGPVESAAAATIGIRRRSAFSPAGRSARPAGGGTDSVQLAHHSRLDRAGQRDDAHPPAVPRDPRRSASSGPSARC